MTNQIDSILKEIVAERVNQDRKWGGPEHDDEHRPEEWAAFIVDHAAKAGIHEDPREFRRRMVRVAALAVAAIESRDRVGATIEGKP